MPPTSPEAFLVLVLVLVLLPRFASPRPASPRLPCFAMDQFRSSRLVLEDTSASLLAALPTITIPIPLHSSASQGSTSPYRSVAGIWVSFTLLCSEDRCAQGIVRLRGSLCSGDLGVES